MLSRTADALFWLGRYNERAGNVSRGLAAALRMSLITGDGTLPTTDDDTPPVPGGGAPSRADEESAEWRALLIACGNEVGFRGTHPVATARAAVEWLTLDPANPSSVAACLEAGRRNARAVRTALTVDMWEAINDTWMELQRIEAAAVSEDRLPAFLDWVKSRTLAFNGAAADTMLRDDAWRFTHLGTMLERADNTARLLDSRSAAFVPDAESQLDVLPRLEAVLRSVSALRAYQHLYRARLDPVRVAELLLLRRELPRSLRFCYARVDATLADIAGDDGASTARELSRGLLRRFEATDAGPVLASGLHAALTAVINDNVRLGEAIARDFLHG